MQRFATHKNFILNTYELYAVSLIYSEIHDGDVIDKRETLYAWLHDVFIAIDVHSILNYRDILGEFLLVSALNVWGRLQKHK